MIIYKVEESSLPWRVEVVWFMMGYGSGCGTFEVDGASDQVMLEHPNTGAGGGGWDPTGFLPEGFGRGIRVRILVIEKEVQVHLPAEFMCSG